MRIGIFTPYLDTLSGGELYMLTIAECLSKENQVDIFWNDKDILTKAEKRFKLDIGRVRVRENFFGTNASFLKRIYKSRKYDKIVYLSDGSLPLQPPNKLIVHFQFPIVKREVPFVERKKIFLADTVICNSYFTKSFIDKTYGISSTVLYPPAQKITTGKNEKKDIILTVGRYQPYAGGSDYKKLDFMIEAFKKLTKLRPEWSLYIVTTVRNEDENRFKEDIESKVPGSVKIIKNASFDRVADVYRMAKIYWHAAGFGENINEHPERAEHFGMSTVEAMSAGCVPVVVNLGGQREIVKNGESGFLWNSEEEMIKLTLNLTKSDEHYQKISREAVRSSDDFGKKKFCEELFHIIQP